MDNLDISKVFKDISRILEIKGDNPFRIRAYLRAADNIEGLTEDITTYANEDRLEEIPGIGKDISNKIKEIVASGRLRAYEDLKKTIPSGLLELLNIPSLGPKTVKLLYDELNIGNIRELEKAAKDGKLLGLAGIKEKTVENILKGIEFVKKDKERMPLAFAITVADEFIKALKKIPEVKKISLAGSLRRMKETIRDIDILMISSAPKRVMEEFTRLPKVKEIMAKGETKSSVLTDDDIQVDARVVGERSFGAALLYFTGSKNFNIKLRHIALKKNLKINEYGLFSTKENKERYVAGKTEGDIFKYLGIDFIVPELREDLGEIEAALKGDLPHLIELGDIKGDVHVHSKWSDGANKISEITVAAKKRGYSYIAITDHSQSLKIAGGLSIRDLKRKQKEIKNLNRQLKNFRILYGTEVDINSEGGIDYEDEILAEFDIVIAAIHSGFKQTKEKLTQRLIKACNNKYVDIIAHPTGRLFGTREAYEVDFDKILTVTKDTGTILEINAFGNRLDLNDINCRKAKEKGVLLSLGTDAHVIDQLDAIQLGLAVARRGWLEKKDVINTLSLESLFKILK